MKTLVFGDTHGRSLWKLIIEQEKNDFDKVIFIGDYFDSWDVGGQLQIENFRDIVAYKMSKEKEVVLLIGNHDFHYTIHADETYSGFQSGFQYTISHQLQTHKTELQMCHVMGRFIFTHAGVTNTWVEANEIDLNDLENSINQRYQYKPWSFRFTMGRNWSETGNDVDQGPIWVRPQSLEKDAIPGTHIVGHTQAKQIINVQNTVLKTDFWLIDAIGINQYIKITDDLVEVKRCKSLKN